MHCSEAILQTAWATPSFAQLHSRFFISCSALLHDLMRICIVVACNRRRLRTKPFQILRHSLASSGFSRAAQSASVVSEGRRSLYQPPLPTPPLAVRPVRCGTVSFYSLPLPAAPSAGTQLAKKVIAIWIRSQFSCACRLAERGRVQVFGAGRRPQPAATLVLRPESVISWGSLTALPPPPPQTG